MHLRKIALCASPSHSLPPGSSSLSGVREWSGSALPLDRSLRKKRTPESENEPGGREWEGDVQSLDGSTLFLAGSCSGFWSVRVGCLG